MADFDRQRVVALLNRILENELAGVVRYTHYSFLVFGYSRIPIVEWLRSQSNEAMMHAQQAGEMITQLGAYPSLAIGPLLDSHKHDIGAILRESLDAEAEALSPPPDRTYEATADASKPHLLAVRPARCPRCYGLATARSLAVTA